MHFFVAGDEKTPEDTFSLCDSIPNCTYLTPEDQEFAGYKCSEIIGWNTTSRRNIALLEALKWGAEILIFHDDDNLPMNGSYFAEFEQLFDADLVPYDGLQVSSSNKWHNQYGANFKHRGFPIEVPHVDPTVSHIVGARVGAAVGLCLGNPDIDAYTRMAASRHIGNVTELSRTGYLVATSTRCVFNSQNTAFLRQFAPCMFLAPGIGRADDIFASLLTQRVMKDAGYQVHIGPPFTYQERNPHDLFTDLTNEMFCMEHVLDIANFIDRMQTGPTVIASCQNFWRGFTDFPQQTVEAALAVLEDVEAVMK